MPLSRPMSVIAPGVRELRVRDESTTVRVFYATGKIGTIVVFTRSRRNRRGRRCARLIWHGEDCGRSQMRKSNSNKPVRVTSAEDLGRALGLSRAEAGEMEFRSELTCALAKIIQNGKLTHAEIARRAGTSRTRVTAIANANTKGVSTDLLLRVLSATGYRAELRVRKAAA